MKTPNPSSPSKNRLIVPGGQKEEVDQSTPPSESEDSQSSNSDNEAMENVSGLKPLFSKKSDEGSLPDEVESAQNDGSAETEDEDFLQVGDQASDQAGQTESAPEPADDDEPKSIRRLLPRGVVDDDTAPVHRHLSNYQTSPVNVATGQVPVGRKQAPQSVDASPAVAGQPAHSVRSAEPQPQRLAPVKPKGAFPAWVFSTVGFVFGVLAVFMFAKMGILPEQLGLTNQESVREAAEDERARIIKLLKSDGYEDVVEDWDNFEDLD